MTRQRARASSSSSSSRLAVWVPALLGVAGAAFIAGLVLDLARSRE